MAGQIGRPPKIPAPLFPLKANERPARGQLRDARGALPALAAVRAARVTRYRSGTSQTDCLGVVARAESGRPR
jgi:hypothetical protein